MKRLNLSERDLSNVHHTLIQLKARWGDSAQRAAKEEEQARIRQNTLASLVSADGLLPQKDNMEEAAERIAQVGRASDGPAQVVQYLSNVLTMYEGDTQPVDDEAVRFIVSFACSLRDPDLGTAPSLQECPSVCTLVPHYNVSCWRLDWRCKAFLPCQRLRRATARADACLCVCAAGQCWQLQAQAE